jgi:hypothetical protein
MGLDTKTYWQTDRQSQCDFDFDCSVKQSLFMTRTVWKKQTYCAQKMLSFLTLKQMVHIMTTVLWKVKNIGYLRTMNEILDN